MGTSCIVSILCVSVSACSRCFGEYLITHVYTYTHTYIYIYACVNYVFIFCVYILMYLLVCSFMFMFVFVYVYSYIYGLTFVCVFLYLHIFDFSINIIRLSICLCIHLYLFKLRDTYFFHPYKNAHPSPTPKFPSRDISQPSQLDLATRQPMVLHPLAVPRGQAASAKSPRANCRSCRGRGPRFRQRSNTSAKANSTLGSAWEGEAWGFGVKLWVSMG